MVWRGDLTPWRADWPATPAEDDTPLRLRDACVRGLFAAKSCLRDADLRRTDLTGADLRGVDLRGAQLTQADLTLADLRDADLRQADLSGADLSGADLRGAQLEGADLVEATLDWAWLVGCVGLEAPWRDRALTADGRLAGPASTDGEPAVALRTFARAVAHWHEGRLHAAERGLRTALRWVPSSDIARYHLGALALQRGDPEGADAWWREAVAQCPEADRARVDLALLAAATDPPRAAALLDDGGFAWAAQAAAALRAGGTAALLACVTAHLGETPASTWLRRPQPAVPRRKATAPDPASERSDLQALLAEPQRPAWVWHGCIARALAIGDMALAQRADQRLRAVAPEQRLWSLGLQQLDLTAEAFAALVRTRRDAVGEIRQLQWMALGVHGPTARLICDGGTFYAKRYHGTTRPAGSVAYTHRVCRGLAERGATVPLALADGSGDDVLVFGDDLLALYPAVRGQPRPDDSESPDDAYALGAALARLHLLGSGLQAAGRPAGGVRTGTRILRQRGAGGAWLAALQREPAALARLAQRGLSTPLAELVEATARRVQPLLLQCPRGLVHGDAGGGNLLWTDEAGEGPALVDWDLADADLWVWDLARAVDLAAVRWPHDSGQDPDIHAPLLRAMVRGYDHVRRLLPAERRVLAVLIAASRIDLDASVIPLGATLELAMADAIGAAQSVRLARAAAGAPELAEVLADALGRDS